MLRNIISLLVLTTLIIACKKGEIGDETTITVTVNDPTTGQTNEKVTLELWEEKSSWAEGAYNSWGYKFSVIETFTVNFGETFDYKFKTRRRDRFTYGLRVSSAGSLLSQEDVSRDIYPINVEQQLEKGTDAFYELSLVPSSSGKFVIVPPFEGWSLNDSVGVVLSDGKYIYSNGIIAGTREWWLFVVPHGQYTLSYFLFDRLNGSPRKSWSYPLYLKHNGDTTLELKF